MRSNFSFHGPILAEIKLFLISYEEDREDNFFDEDDPLWLAAHGGARPRRRHLNGSAIHSDSDSDDGAIEIRPASYRHSNSATPHAKRRAPPRSKSASSSSSTTTTTSSASASSPSGRPRQRRKSASAVTNNIPPSDLLSVPPPSSAYRPRPVLSSHSSDPPYRDRVTIAPIAPTLLKTTGAWEEGFGDEGGASDDGLWNFNLPRHGVNGRSSGSSERNKKGVGGREDEGHSSEGTPVELVYVPPFGSVYGYGAATYWRNRHTAEEDDEDEIDEVKEVETQLATPRQEEKPKSAFVRETIGQEAAAGSIPSSPIPAESTPPISRSPVPVVIVDSSVDVPQPATSTSSDMSGSSSNSSDSTSTTTPVPVPSRGRHTREEERERGRSASISPIGVGSSSKASVSSSSGNGGLLASRGRSQSCQDLQSFYNPSIATTSSQGGERRGRSNLRGSSGNGTGPGSWRGPNSSRSSQSHSGGRSGGSGSVSPNNVNSGSSSLGDSVSPDGSDSRLGGIGSVYASGRIGGRERERVERVSSSSSLSVSGGSDERRGRDRGRRVIGSGSGSSSSPIASATSPPEEARDRGRSDRTIRGRGSLSPQAVPDVEPASSPTTTVTISGEVKGKARESNVPAETSISVVSDTTSQTSPSFQGVEMDASMCSVSSEGSTATIVPACPIVAPQPAPSQTISLGAPLLSDRKQELEREAMADAESWRKTMPTPSNSPIISMTAPPSGAGERETATPTSLPPPMFSPASQPSQTETPTNTSGHMRTASASSTHSPSTPSPKLKTKSTAPIVPSPPHPALPSTSPSHAPGEVGPSVILTGFGVSGRSASTSLERASSGSRERHSPSTSSGTTQPGSGLRREITADMERERELAEARRGRNNVVGGVSVAPRMDATANGTANGNAGLKEPTSPVLDGHKERGTIINKAVGMVSSAGAYLRLWPNYGGA